MRHKRKKIKIATTYTIPLLSICIFWQIIFIYFGSSIDYSLNKELGKHVLCYIKYKQY